MTESLPTMPVQRSPPASLTFTPSRLSNVVDKIKLASVLRENDNEGPAATSSPLSTKRKALRDPVVSPTQHVPEEKRANKNNASDSECTITYDEFIQTTIIADETLTDLPATPSAPPVENVVTPTPPRSSAPPAASTTSEPLVPSAPPEELSPPRQPTVPSAPPMDISPPLIPSAPPPVTRVCSPLPAAPANPASAETADTVDHAVPSYDQFLISKECPNHWPEDAKVELQRLRNRIKFLTEELSIAKRETMNGKNVEINDTDMRDQPGRTANVEDNSQQNLAKLITHNRGQRQVETLPIPFPAATQSEDQSKPVIVNKAPHTAIIIASFGRELGQALKEENVDADVHCFPGASLSVFTTKAMEIFTPEYQPSEVIIHGGNIDCLHVYAPQVVDLYKRLVNVIKGLVPKALIHLSSISYMNFYNHNLKRFNRFTPGDPIRVDVVNRSMSIWAKTQERVRTFSALPPALPEYFNPRDGLHFSNRGKAVFHAKMCGYITTPDFMDVSIATSC